jgi:hypothetical protein
VSALEAYSVRFPTVDLIVRGVNHTISAPVYRDGVTPVLPLAASVQVFDANNAEVLNETASIVASAASYTIPAGTTSGLTLQIGWRVEWTLQIGSQQLLARNDAALIRRELYPVIGDADMIRRVNSLDSSSATSITARTNLQDHLDESWVQITNRLIEETNRPNLIMSPSSLREVHLELALSLVFADLATRLNPAYRELAQDHRALYEQAWGRLRFVYDYDDDGQADSDSERRAAQSTIWLG